MIHWLQNFPLFRYIWIKYLPPDRCYHNLHHCSYPGHPREKQSQSIVELFSIYTFRKVDNDIPISEIPEPSSIFSTPLNDKLLDLFIRLLEIMDNPRDASVLSEPVMEEIYYRMLVEGRGIELRQLIQQRGEIQLISKALDHIHQTIGKPVPVEKLAGIVHMSHTTFFLIILRA